MLGDEMSEMFESGLDAIEESNNTVVRYMNHRVDEISSSVNAAMHNENIMEFAGMALGMPLLGLGLVSLKKKQDWQDIFPKFLFWYFFNILRRT